MPGLQLQLHFLTHLFLVHLRFLKPHTHTQSQNPVKTHRYEILKSNSSHLCEMRFITDDVHAASTRLQTIT